MSLIVQPRSTVEVNNCLFELMIGNGIEISDTLTIDCTIVNNNIKECLNGILVRDYSSISLGPTNINSERTNAAHSITQNSRGSLTILTSRVYIRSYRLQNNMITNNKGSGLKIENSSTLIHLTGGSIAKNKDLAVGVIGNIDKVIVIDSSPSNKVNIQGSIKEIRFEDDLATDDKCTLV